MSSKNPIDKWDTPQGRRVKAQCFKRDRAVNAPCIWCHAPIDYSIGPYTRGGDTWAWSPEHIKPRDRWPELALDPANIAPAHFRCNVRRRDKAGLTNLGRPSRDWGCGKVSKGL